MPVHGIAHVIGDVLRDPCSEIAFKNTDQICGERHGKGQHDKQNELVQIPRNESVVDDLSGQNRGHQRQDRRDQDRQQHTDHLFGVWLQI